MALATLNLAAPNLCAQQSSNNWLTAQDVEAFTPTTGTLVDAVTGEICGTLDSQGAGLSLGNVTQGQQYSYSASGCITYQVDVGGGPQSVHSSDPDGNSYTNTCANFTSGPSVAGGGFPCPGLYSVSLVGQIAGGSCLQLGEDGCFTASATGELVVYYNDNLYGDNSGSWLVCLQPAAATEDYQATASCSGFDASLDPHWIMVPTPGNNTATLTFTDAGTIAIVSADPTVASVSPSSTATSPQMITVTGALKGTTKITAASCGVLNVSVKTRLTKTVAIHAIIEENDDVQVITNGNGLANATCITPGSNGRLDSTPAGDDKKQGNNINTGANGICETTAAGDDVQVILLGHGQPNATCVTPGHNKFRDTAPLGDDGVSADDKNITTGADGICNTTANAENLIPVSVPTAATLESYLNNVIWGKQANAYFTVSRSDKAVNYDLNRNSQCDGNLTSFTDEETAIINAANDNRADLNVYYVNTYSLADGGTLFQQSFIGDDHPDSTENITAHEIGHGLGIHYESTDPMDIMFGPLSSSNPCNVKKSDWDTVNQ